MQESPFHIPASFRPVFTAGGTLSRGIRVLLDKPLPFLALFLLQVLPVVAIYGALFATGFAQSFDPAATGITAVYPTWFWFAYPLTILSVIPFVAMLDATGAHLRGKPIALGDSLAVGVKRLVPFVVVYFLFSLAMTLGFVLLIIPGFIVMTVLFMSLPVAVFERRGIFGALGRGASLSKGYRMTMFGIGVGYWALAIAGYVGAALVALAVGAITGLTFDSPVGMLAAVPFWFVVYFAIVALFPILMATSYHALIEDKEGIATEQVAGVFA